MNRLFAFFCTASFLFLAACKPNPEEEKVQTVPQREFTEKADTTCLDEPATKSDIVFDDFLLAYTSDPALQRRRTHFPLRLREKDGKETLIEAEKWTAVSLLGEEELYTLISNNEAELDLSTSTELEEGHFEWIFLGEEEVCTYHFYRNGQGAWYLELIEKSPLLDNPNGPFLEFYKKFSTDPDFQKRHVRNPIDFITNFTDENEGFNTEHFRLEVGQWMAWQVPMPTQQLTNIVYGQADSMQTATSRLKIMTIRSMDGTFFKALYFRKNRIDDWYLYRYEDTAY